MAIVTSGTVTAITLRSITTNLSDGSEVTDILLSQSGGIPIVFHCVSNDHADVLLNTLRSVILDNTVDNVVG
jgi:hypothetical protein